MNLVGLPQASTVASNFDSIYSFIFWVSLISFLIIVIGLIVFVLLYRKRSGKEEKTPYIEGYTPIEITWSVILFVLVMIIFVWGWMDYKKIIRTPADALEINVIGRQWLWQIWYLNGRQLTNELVVPKGRKVKLLMSSADVIHSFYIPAFRLKQDVVPGTYTTLWFEATQTGEYSIFCAEYCGSAHSKMLGKVRVVESEAYDAWYKEWNVAKKGEGEKKDEKSLASEGEKLFSAKGCNACHTVTGQKLVGPSLKGALGRESEFSDGKKGMVDENYIRESLMDPRLKLVKGFPPVMPTFRGVLTDEEINALIAYIKSLK